MKSAVLRLLGLLLGFAGVLGIARASLDAGDSDKDLVRNLAQLEMQQQQVPGQLPPPGV